MADFDWRATIGAVAPGLATALGGPLAGAAVKVIADKVFGNPNASEADLAAALALGTLTGEQIKALKQAEMEMQVELARIGQASDAAYLADTDSARKQTTALAQSGSGIAWGAPVVSTLIVVGYFACIYMLFLVDRQWDERTSGLLNNLFGALTAAFIQVANYWLGSSAGSKRAGDSLRKIAEQPSKS